MSVKIRKFPINPITGRPSKVLLEQRKNLRALSESQETKEKVTEIKQIRNIQNYYLDLLLKDL